MGYQSLEIKRAMKAYMAPLTCMGTLNIGASLCIKFIMKELTIFLNNSYNYQDVHF